MLMYFFALLNLAWGIAMYPSCLAVASFVIAGLLIGMETMDRINAKCFETEMRKQIY